MPYTCEPHSDWDESTLDDAKDMAAIIGIDIDDIYYSGFSSQGDGASFTGSYAYAKGASARIRAEAPLDTELHAITDKLATLQRGQFYGLAATISKPCFQYSHENTMAAEVEHSSDRDVGEDISDAMLEAFRDFARWIYHNLEREYDYQCAWDAASHWQDLAETAAAERADARQLIRDIRNMRNATTDAPASICNALRSRVRSHLDAMARAYSERAEIADAFRYDNQSIAQFAAVHL